MKFEKFDEGAVRGRAFDERRAILTKQGILTFNRAAITELGLADVAHLTLHYSKDDEVIGLQPVEDEQRGSRKLSISKSSANVSIRAFLTHYGLNVDSPQRYEPTHSDEHDMILLDLRDPVDIESQTEANPGTEST